MNENNGFILKPETFNQEEWYEMYKRLFIKYVVLEEKINEAAEYIINRSEEYKPHFRKIELDTVQCNELLNILEEDKIQEIPQFKGTMEQLDDLCNIRKEDK